MTGSEITPTKDAFDGRNCVSDFSMRRNATASNYTFKCIYTYITVCQISMNLDNNNGLDLICTFTTTPPLQKPPQKPNNNKQKQTNYNKQTTTDFAML